LDREPNNKSPMGHVCLAGYGVTYRPVTQPLAWLR